jgi:hypothetical protein
MDFELITQGDTVQFVNIADNVLGGRGYSSAPEAPWGPDASRTPGMLLTNLPLRFAFGKADVVVAIVGKAMLVAAAALVVVIARYLGAGDYALLGGALLTVIPGVMYYSVNPYSTGLPYLFSTSALFASCALVLQSRRGGALLLALSSAYAIALRPAAIFPLMWLVGLGFALRFFLKEPELRRKMGRVALAILIGTFSVYLAWSFRNLQLFGSFQYSSVQGFNLLHFNAHKMEPFMDEAGKRELNQALDAYPQYIHDEHGPDQLEIASLQGELGVDLIWRHPWAFLASHFSGILNSLFFFRVRILQEFFGIVPLYAVAAVQTAFTIAGLVGLFKRIGRMDAPRRTLVWMMLTTGAMSLLSSGALARPKFRLPLEIPIALGCMFLVQDIFARGQESVPAQAGEPVTE